MMRLIVVLVALAVSACGNDGGTTPDAAGPTPDAAGSDLARATDTAAPATDTAAPAIDTAAPAIDTAAPTTGKTLEECFAGLRPLVGASQIATRASADGKYRMRLALETADRSGTSGSVGYLPVRLGLETPEGRHCLTDESILKSTYKGSHHNCNDVLTVEAAGRRYVIQNPDSAIEYTDQTKWRRLARLTVFSGATMTAGPIEMPTVSCDRSSFADGKCRSGGPCQ
jgi:hypothetical protein